MMAATSGPTLVRTQANASIVGDPRREKRQKVAAACDQCRLKKAKCDACKPVCGPCRGRHGLSATCNWGARRGRGRALAKNHERAGPKRRRAESQARRTRSAQGEPTSCELIASSPPADSTRGSADNQTADGITKICSVEGEELTTLQNHNHSSVTGFMVLIKNHIDSQTSPQEGQTPLNLAKTPPQSRSKQRIGTRPQDVVLPSRQLADHLLRIYTHRYAELFPFLDLDEIQLLYHRLWTGEDLGDDTCSFLCVINVMFSIACNLDSSAPCDERIANGEVFYARAQKFVQPDVVKRCSLLNVQCLLLLGQYLHLTVQVDECSIVSGSAIRMAQKLGLDVPSTSAKLSPQRREVYRRVWYGCVIMDQIVYMTFGEAAMITFRGPASVPLPLAHPEGSCCACFSERGSESAAPDLHCYVETLKLYSLMDGTLHKLYSSEPAHADSKDPNVVYFGRSGATAVGTLLEIDHTLSCWYESLPPHLRQSAASTSTSTSRHQSIALGIKYNHVRMLLFRPILASFCAQGQMQDLETLPAGMALLLSTSCLKAAIGTINTFETIISGRKVSELEDVLPPWWHNILYVCTAATILVTAELTPALLAKFPQDTVSQTWNTAMEIMAQYEPFSKHAKRCSAELRSLWRKAVLRDQQPEHGRDSDGAHSLSSPSLIPEFGHPHTSFSTRPSCLPAFRPEDWGLSPTDATRSAPETPSVESVARHFNIVGRELDIFADNSWLNDLVFQS